MHIEVVQLSFQLDGCQSLKEKRKRMVRLRDRFGRMPNLAVSETGSWDVHSRSEWSIVAVAQNSRVVERLLTDVLNWADQSLDALLCDIQRSRVLPGFDI